MKTLTILLMAALSMAATSGCRSKSGEVSKSGEASEGPKSAGAAEGSSEPAKMGSAAVAGSASMAPAGSSADPGSGNAAPGSGSTATEGDSMLTIQECADYKAAIEKVMSCDKMLKFARDSLKSAFDTMLHGGDMKGATDRDRKMVGDACKTQLDLVTKAATKSGCK